MRAQKDERDRGREGGVGGWVGAERGREEGREGGRFPLPDKDLFFPASGKGFLCVRAYIFLVLRYGM